MKTPSGTFALRLGILVASATASIVLISACEKSSVPPSANRPILIMFKEPGVKVTKGLGDVQEAFQALGPAVCNVDAYHDNGSFAWHEGTLRLTMTRAIRSEAAAKPAPADPSNLVQRVAFNTLDEAQQFLFTINPTPTPTPTPTSTSTPTPGP